MRKFIVPIINLINVALVSIIFGLGNNDAYTYAVGESTSHQRWYHLVWTPIDGHPAGNVIGIVGFFLFVFAALGVLLVFIPTKLRKFVNLLVGGELIAAGILFAQTPHGGFADAVKAIELSDSLKAMSVLAYVAGGLAILMMIIDFIPKKKAVEVAAQ